MAYIDAYSSVIGQFVRVRNIENLRSICEWVSGHGFCNNDVTTRLGLRGSRTFSFGFLSLEGATGRRKNAFFQNNSGCVGTDLVDAPVRTFSITFRPTYKWRKEKE